MSGKRKDDAEPDWVDGAARAAARKHFLNALDVDPSEDETNPRDDVRAILADVFEEPERWSDRKWKGPKKRRRV